MKPQDAILFHRTQYKIYIYIYIYIYKTKMSNIKPHHKNGSNKPSLALYFLKINLLNQKMFQKKLSQDDGDQRSKQ